MSCRPFSVMLASMPAGTNSTVAIESKQLLLTIGRAGVLSSRAIAAGELETLLRLLGPPSERQRSDLKRATDIVLVEDGTLIYWPRTGEQYRRRRLCHGARASDARMSTATLKRELASAPQLARSSDTDSVCHARRSHRLGRAHRRADARSLAARCAALRRAASAPQCHATERQEHSGRAQGRPDGFGGRPCRGGLAVAASVRLPVPQARPSPRRLRRRLPARDAHRGRAGLGRVSGSACPAIVPPCCAACRCATTARRC